ncbi:hypothetical protein [Erythrobacter mangrovi]|uniref:Uncharacterized protein n=1 Tax=Erythrobacter mangrovi TaxID=2739433 RepID=A0A7D3XBY2_9SPHN|nr:hypothetical protein [Erythrobacter mangrovi]QKG71460.1 hypothetical protein HQR01_08850 [Erythrobacter mangrovi]
MLVEQESHDKSFFDIEDRRNWVWLGFVSILAVISIDDFFSDSVLVTPINPDLNFGVTATCAVLGFALAFWRLLNRTGRRRRLGDYLVVFLVAPLLAGMWGNVTVWRMAEHLAFFGSDASWEPAVYPVQSFVRNTRRRRPDTYKIKIDPFGARNVDIPIPYAQYDQFRRSSAPVCVTVLQRESPSGAVQIITNGGLDLGTPEPVQLHSC